jgi:hypothetical protein
MFFWLYCSDIIVRILKVKSWKKVKSFPLVEIMRQLYRLYKYRFTRLFLMQGFRRCQPGQSEVFCYPEKGDKNTKMRGNSVAKEYEDARKSVIFVAVTQKLSSNYGAIRKRIC